MCSCRTPPPVDAEALQEYLAQIEHAASSLGVQVGPSEWSDDHWEAKLAGLVQHPVAVVSFALDARHVTSSPSSTGSGRR